MPATLPAGEDPVVNIALSYAIYGGYYAYEENLRYGGEQVAEVVAQASRDIHPDAPGEIPAEARGVNTSLFWENMVF